MRNMPKSVGFPVVLLALGFSIAGLAHAQNSLDAKEQALALITRTADKICNVVETGGSTQSSEVRGEVRTELRGLASRLLDAGISGSGKITSSEYRGVLQNELAATLGRNADCKFKVFESLRDTLIGRDVGFGIDSEPTRSREPPPVKPRQ
jgi:hypothetical protein